jgi:5-dehydro-4-deoxyglucarate dehydratase
MNPQELKTIMGSGLLSFPLTDFDSNGDFNKKGYIERLEWLAPYGASALFAAGGTGEFFSLTGDEYPGIIQTAVDTCRGKVPIIAGAGGPTRFAIQCAQAAEKAGAHGILLLPHYLTEAGQEGLAAHVEAVCKSVKFGVIVYNRASSRLKPDTLAGLAERNPNLVGFKDGVGDIERWSRSTRRWATASPTWAACRPPRSTPRPTRPWARRCIRRPSSTSSPRRRWTSITRWPTTTSPRSTAC